MWVKMKKSLKNLNEKAILESERRERVGVMRKHAAHVVGAAAAVLVLTCIVIGSAQLRSSRAVLLAKSQAKQARMQALAADAHPNAVSVPSHRSAERSTGGYRFRAPDVVLYACVVRPICVLDCLWHQLLL